MIFKNKRLNGVLIISVLLLALLSRFFVMAGTESASLSGSVYFENVTGQISLWDLMAANFNNSVITSSTSKSYERRTVIISLDGDSLIDFAGDTDIASCLSDDEGINKIRDMRSEQDAFLNKLDDAGIEYTLENRYFAIDNAVAVEINTAYVADIRKMSGVSGVVISGSYSFPKSVSDGAVNNVTSVYGTGVYDSSAAVADGLDGSGTVVAIIDTGLDYTHSAFLDMPSGTNPVRFTEEYINAFLTAGTLKADTKNNGSLSLADVYINAKVPFAYDYADNDPDVYPSYSTHGTHVAGIVAGHDAGGYTDKDGNHVDEEFIGVAPEAQLVICKVFTDDLESTDLGGAETEDILSALEDCVLLGVDVINMSLGTSCGFTTTNDGDDEGEYLNRVYTSIGEHGISLVCAASNDYSSGYGSVFGTNLASNPDSGTVGSPATFGSALSVASISGKQSDYFVANGVTPVFFEQSNDEDNNPFDFMKMMLGEDGTVAEFEYVVVPGVGRAVDYTSAIKALFAENPNRIALVERGDNTFKEKVEIAKSMGAKGIIVYNNVSGVVRMSLGDVDDPIPSASIDMNAGAAMVAAAMNHTQEELDAGAQNRVGTIVLDTSLKAGPFMSEFSSWGCTPDLKLKPEITAHGGEITSTVPGGYGEQSGTSMASPNMAGVVALIRSYVKYNNVDMTPVEVTQRVNQLLMSTATTVYDKDGLPYSPRKQGAGLGSLDNARTTSAYLWTDNASVDYRPKAELGDDAEKIGVYTVSFMVTNFGAAALSFKTQSIFMTETLAIDGLSVAEQAYILDDIAAIWTVDGAELSEGASFTVAAGETKDVVLVVTLSDDEKNYIDQSFVNGMFVEGFAKLISNTDSQCDLVLPFMGFYGDWTKAPMLDYDAYELAKYEQDSSILDDEKPKASVWASQPYTVYSNDQYVLPMGTYVYLLDEDAEQVYTSMDYNSVSCFNEYYGKNDAENYLTAYKLKGLYAGLLRNARYVNYTLVNADTDEVLISDTVNRVGKAYADGGSARPAFVDVPLDPVQQGLVSNGRYIMSFEFFLDYGDGSCEKNTFSYEFTVDYEAPVLEDVRVRYYNYKDGNKVKQKIYLDMDVYDNHYAQSVMLCYLNGDELVLATDYVTPVYNPVKNGTKTVSIDITDVYDKYKDAFYVQIDDYAMNHSVYWLNLSSVGAEDSIFELEDGEESIELSVFDTHTVSLSGIGNYDISEYNWTSDNRSIADVKNGEIVGISAGNAVVTVSDNSGNYKTINVTVKEGSKTLSTPSISFGAIKDGSGALKKAQGVVEVYPGNAFHLDIMTEPWYYPVGTLTLAWESTNPKVAEVDDDGNITVLEEGVAVIKASIVANGQVTAYSATVTLKVDDPFEVSNYSLIKYHGGGGVVVIPTDKNINMIGENAFKDNDAVTEVVIPKSVTSIGTGAFENCTSLRRVSFVSTEEQPIADADVNLIYSRAFAGCTSLELLDLSNVKVITLGNECFSGCTSLSEIRKMTKIGSAYDYAFANCTSLTSLDLTGMHVSGYGVFSGCTSLAEIKTGRFTSIGTAMFVGCTSLRSVDISCQIIGESAFEGCTALRNVTLVPFSDQADSVFYIQNRAFAGCTSLQSFNVESGCKIATVGDYAFSSTSLAEFTVPAGLTMLGTNVFAGSSLETVVIGDDFSFDTLDICGVIFGNVDVELAPTCTKYVIENGVVYNKSKTKLLLVLPTTKSVVIPDTVTSIGDYSFASSSVMSVVIPSGVKHIGTGAFYGSDLLSIDLSRAAITVIEPKTFANSKLATVTVPASVTYIADSAFENTPVISVNFVGNSLKQLGNRVFYGCSSLNSVSLPRTIASIGNHTFAYCTALTDAIMPDVKTLGDYTFAGCTSLKSVVFADGAETIGCYTFYNNTALTSVSFGDGITAVGDYAFCGCSALEEINIGCVTSVGNNAFAECVSLKNVISINRLVNIGDTAFYNCKSIPSLDLEKAEYIGAGAFAVENGNVSYTSLSIPSVKYIGVMAFMGGNEACVELPASLEAVGYGAFCGSKNLVSISVSPENNVFFDVDGVLYRVLPNGKYELTAYPSARTDTDRSYTVIDNTAVLNDYAFNRLASGALKQVVLPYSLNIIGVSAFYESGIESYVFNSIQAPVLHAAYREDTTKLLENNATGNQIVVNGLYYANFDSLFAKHTEIVGEESKLVMSIPQNGIGYDNYVYTRYFGKVNSLGILIDDTTRSAINAIEALDDLDTVKSWTSLEINEANKAMILRFADSVKEARRLYNNIISDEQRAFVSDGLLNKLVDIEGVVRIIKENFGIMPVISELKPQAGYRSEYVEGEAFSTDGLVLIVVYDDGSTELADVSSLVLKSPSDGILTVYDNFVVFDYYYGENGSLHREVNISVTVRASAASSEDASSASENENDGIPVGVIALITAGGLLACGGVAFAVIVLVRRRKSSASRRNKKKHFALPFGKIIKWAVAVLVVGGIVFGIVYLVINSNGDDSDADIEQVRIVYYANGGIFENNTDEKTISYNVGSYPLEIGKTVVTNGSVGITRNGYLFSGWYYAATDSSGKPLTDENGGVLLGDAFDFSKKVTSGQNAVIYACWIKDKTLPIVLAGEAIRDKNGNEYAVGDVIRELYANPQGEFVKFTGSNLLDIKSGEFTFVQYYSDSDCTVPVAWPIKPNDDAEAAPIYAKFIAGDWKIVSDADSAKKMLGSLISGNYYVIADIDLGGAAVSISNNATFAAKVEGNGHVISDFSVVKRSVESQGTSLFGTFKEGASFHNITLTDIDFEISLKGDATAVYFLFGSVTENPDISGVTVSGSVKINLPSGCGIGNIQSGNHSNWILPCDGGDDAALADGKLKVSVNCTIGDEVYTYPEQ